MGLGCNPWSEFAVDTILALKQRPMHKGLILVAASVEQVRFLLDPLPSDLRQRAEQHWPGPVTCVVPDPLEQIPVGCGVTTTPLPFGSARILVQRLCILAGMPLVSTSCNPAGREPARAPWQVSRYFPAGIDLMVSGALGGARQPVPLSISPLARLCDRRPDDRFRNAGFRCRPPIPLRLQESICERLEALDGKARFVTDSWDRPEGGVVSVV